MKKIALDEFCNLKFLANVKFSPKGTSAAFTLSEIDKEKDCYKTYIYVKKGENISKLTGLGKESNYFYLDDNTILFAGNREEKSEGDISSRFYEIKLDGGEASLKYTFPIPVFNLKMLNNGDYILMGTMNPGFEDLYKGDKKLLEAYNKHLKDNKDYDEIKTNPWWFNGEGYTNGTYNALFYYETKKNKLSLLSETKYNVETFNIDQEKENVYFYASERKPFNGLNDPGFIYKYNLSTKKTKMVHKFNDNLLFAGFELLKSFMLVFVIDTNKFGLNSDFDFYKIDYKTNSFEKYLKYDESIGCSTLSDVRYIEGGSTKVIDDTLYFTSTRYEACKLFKLEDGKISEIISKQGSVDCFDVYENNILLVGMYDMLPQELYDGNLNRLTKFNDKVLANKYIAKPEPIIYHNDNVELHGYVMHPIDYNPKKKYPVILDVHGGPKCAYSDLFFHEMQYWTSQGYFVIYCNPRGGDGRGQEKFANIMGKYGTIDYEDIMKFVDVCLLKYKSMDKDNLFETGGSYGGYMSNWIAGHTNRFKAIASQRSISNWLSFSGVSDIGVIFTEDQNKANLFKNPSKLWKASPLAYADKVKTPMLFIHSYEDYRCPINQGFEMYSALVSNGIEAKMVCFKGENHELSRSGKPSHRIHRLDEITKWFDAHKS